MCVRVCVRLRACVCVRVRACACVRARVRMHVRSCGSSRPLIGAELIKSVFERMNWGSVAVDMTCSGGRRRCTFFYKRAGRSAVYLSATGLLDFFFCFFFPLSL